VRDLEQGLAEHDMGEPHARDRARALHDEIERGGAPIDPPPKQHRQRHRRIEMRGRDRSEHMDQHDQARARCQRVAEQGDCDIPARQPLGHDAGADDDREQQQGPKEFGGEPPIQADRPGPDLIG